MRISTIGYILKQGIKNIFRNFRFSLASIATMSACIFLFGLFLAVIMNFNTMVRNVEEEVGITVFFDEDIKQEQIDEIGKQIESRSEVKEVIYVSAEEAWEEYKEEYFEGNSDAAEGFKDDNPIASSSNYEVYVNSVESQEELADFISELEGVRKVNRSEEAGQTLTTLNKFIGYVSIVIIAILFAVAFFLISNTVSMGISVRKEEIGIMKLIGATNFFVRAPFVVEGVIIGLVGALIPLAVVYIGYNKVIDFIQARFQIFANVGNFETVSDIFQILLPASAGLGVGIGLLGSFFAIRKHLKV